MHYGFGRNICRGLNVVSLWPGDNIECDASKQVAETGGALARERHRCEKYAFLTAMRDKLVFIHNVCNHGTKRHETLGNKQSLHKFQANKAGNQ